MCINPPSAVAQCTDLLLSQSGPGQNRCEPGGRYDLPYRHRRPEWHTASCRDGG